VEKTGKKSLQSGKGEKAMESNVLFSLADVQAIRQEIETRYAPASAERRAELVAAAIRRTIRSRLPDWTEPWQGKIANILVRRCLVEERREIRKEDVLQVCADLKVSFFAGSARKDAPASGLAGTFGHARDSASSLEANEPKSAAARLPRLAWLVASFALAGGLILGLQKDLLEAPARPSPEPPPAAAAQEAPSDDAGMPAMFRYQPIQTEAVKDYLRSRNSLLAEEPYFSAIVSQAEAFDLNPLLLFAIAGQEQGFVPKSHKQAAKIANNPFNVYHSWEEFNTDISHSAEIAARTIVRRIVSRPEGYDPFVWLNMTYAEDPGWARGVRQIFEKLASLAAPTAAREGIA